MVVMDPDVHHPRLELRKVLPLIFLHRRSRRPRHGNRVATAPLPPLPLALAEVGVHPQTTTTLAPRNASATPADHELDVTTFMPFVPSIAYQ